MLSKTSHHISLQSSENWVLRTGVWGYSGHRFTKSGKLIIGKMSPGMMNLDLTSAAWIHQPTFPCVNGSGWCNGMRNFSRRILCSLKLIEPLLNTSDYYFIATLLHRTVAISSMLMLNTGSMYTLTEHLWHGKSRQRPVHSCTESFWLYNRNFICLERRNFRILMHL